MEWLATAVSVLWREDDPRVMQHLGEHVGIVLELCGAADLLGWAISRPSHPCTNPLLLGTLCG